MIATVALTFLLQVGAEASTFHHLEPDQRVGIVAEETCSAEAESLRKDLTSSGVKVVVLSGILKKLIDQVDTTIARECTRFHLAKMIVIRRDEQARVTSRLYDAEGQFLEESSTPTPEHEVSEAPVPATLEATPTVAAASPKYEPVPEALWSRWLTYKPITFSSPDYDFASGSPGRVYVGKNLRPVSWLELYETIARPDLAARFRVRRALRASLSIGGLVLLGAGGAVATSGVGQMSVDQCGPHVHVTCNFDNTGDVLTLVTGAVLAVVGTALTIVGLTLDVVPQPAYEVRDAVDAYNARLRAP